MRSKDRLAELHRLAESAGGVYRETVTVAVPDADADAHRVEAVFLEVERIRGWIRELHEGTQLMRSLHSDPTFHTNKQLQERLEAVGGGAGAAAVRACEALRAWEPRAARARGNGAHARIVRLQYAVTRRLFADALRDHHAVLQAQRDARLLLLRHQLALTNLSISDEECQNLLDSKNISLFVDNVGAETAEARRALRAAEQRHEELSRVERALRDVRDLFAQLAHLVAAQQEQVDSVEYYALQATEHVEFGGRQLLKGTVSHTKARKKKLGLVLCLAAGFAVVLLVLVLT